MYVRLFERIPGNLLLGDVRLFGVTLHVHASIHLNYCNCLISSGVVYKHLYHLSPKLTTPIGTQIFLPPVFLLLGNGGHHWLGNLHPNELATQVHHQPDSPGGLPRNHFGCQTLPV